MNMLKPKPCALLVLLWSFSLAGRAATPGDSLRPEGGALALRDEWIDADTGHRVARLSRVPGASESFYFHQNAFTSEGDKMVFANSVPGASNRLFVLDLATRKAEPLTEPGATGAIVGRRSRKVYYQRQGVLYATHLDTRETKALGQLPPRGSAGAVNADETLAAGTCVTGGPEIDRSGPRSAWFDKVFEAKRPQSLYTVELATGKTNVFYGYEGWLNHLQFSPTDPGLLMFCHEGPWHKLDRIWNIRIDGSGLWLMHRRSMDMEIAGHEFWSPDGKQIWFDLQMPRGVKFFLASVDVAGGKEIRYALERDQWSVHYNISRDQKLFAGDGGAGNMVAHSTNAKWIWLFTPQPDGTLKGEHLVNMARHDYLLEPNVNFTPDGKWLVFRGNFGGSPQVYAVEVSKPHRDETSSKSSSGP
jgi:oligogalacturonide lyase